MATRDNQRRYVERRAASDPEAYAAERRAARAKWQQANAEKHRAHNIVYRAVRSGRLQRPDTCQRCGAEGKPEASHHDYGQPLDVEWLCRRCHAEKDLLGVPRPTARQIVCRRGHELDETNTYIGSSGRQCRTCRNASRRRSAARTEGD